MRQTGVSCRRNAKVLLIYINDTGIFEVGHGIRCAIRGTVIDDDELEIRHGLFQHGLDGLPQECGPVECGNDDGYQNGASSPCASIGGCGWV